MLEALKNAGLLDPRYDSDEWQAYAAAHFRPHVDLERLESAQVVYAGCPHPRMVEGLESEFSRELLTAEPSLQAQRERPN